MEGVVSFEEDGKPVVLCAHDKPLGLKILTINRPKSKNAVHDGVYTLLMKHMQEAIVEEEIKAVLVTGYGDFFCAGADLVAGFDPTVGPLKSGKGSLFDPVGRFINELITFPKLLVAAVNGPAIGIGATMLGHFDVVYMTENSFLSTPFVTLCATPEACSSYIFPKILGHTLARQMLLLAKQVSSSEARAAGFAADILPSEGFLERVKLRLKPALLSYKSKESFMRFKRLMNTKEEVEKLKAIHTAEMKLLDERSIGQDSDIATGVRLFKESRSKKSNI